MSWLREFFALALVLGAIMYGLPLIHFVFLGG